MRRFSLAISGLAGLALLASCGPEGADTPQDAESAALASPAAALARVERPVPDQYIVLLHPDRDPAAEAPRLAQQHGAQVLHVYQFAVRGFAARMSATAAAAISRAPGVLLVEEDGEVEKSEEVQSSATWGLDRIDETARVLDGLYHYASSGSGVHAYVIDTGIHAAHSDFGGRIGDGFTAINDGRGTNDCDGHGTHVAGTIGSGTWGVAKGVQLHPVRVLDCRGSGTWSGVVAGVDWVTGNAARPAVANMSLSGGGSTAADNAVASSIASGITYAVAAGNSSANACNYSPARVGAALTVGATTSGDAVATYSNQGSCLDLFAPGSSITSTWNNGGTYTISGTSMASPHVAGAAALYLGNGHASASAAEVAGAVVGAATPGLLTRVASGTPNRLLYAYGLGGGTAAEPPPPPPPTGTTPAATPTFSPSGGGGLSGDVPVTIASETPNATIRYTTDGSTPTGASPVYSAPVVLSTTTTLKAIATAEGYAPSAVASAKFNFRKR